MHLVRRTLQVSLLAMASIALFVFGTGAARGQSATVSEEYRQIVEYLLASEFHLAEISPDGKHVVTIGDSGSLFDTETFKARRISTLATSNSGFWRYTGYARKIAWITNDTFVVDYGVKSIAYSIDGSRTFEVGESVLAKVNPSDANSPWIYSTLEKGSRSIAKVNVETGEFRKSRLPVDGEPFHYVFDAAGELRALMVRDTSFWAENTKISNWYKPRDSKSWQKVAEFGVTENGWQPIFVPNEDNTLYVISSKGRDTRAVFSFNTKTQQFGEMLAGHPNQDIIDVDGFDQRFFRGVVTQGLKAQTFWFDPVWGTIQRSIDAAIPGRTNYVSGDPKNRVLVRSFGDTSPPTLHLFDTKAKTLRLLTITDSTKSKLPTSAMETISYKSSDGLTIPAYLSRPQGELKQRPMVVLIHGGPTARDYWGWDAEVQILASQGYVVFQPQFRGSTGFGDKFREAGYRQWGLAMQDDISAGVEHLIAQGIADPKRICIVGASYGGYAALWGLVKTPGLYRCGVSFAGVTDIGRMFTDSSDSNEDRTTREIMRWRIGDQALSQAQFDSVSPLKHADRINAPVLLMHGEKDQRVPIGHGLRMRDALTRAGKNVQWHRFDDEGHGLVYLKSQLTYYKTLLAFLASNLK
jgi:dipeptidyl aminopeptidase/acylaminoacyl peptidase